MSTKLMGWVSNTQEPKRLNRYELLLTDALRLTCKATSMPAPTIEQTDIHRMHELYKVAGSKVTWNDLTFTFYDFVDNAAAGAIEAWHKQVYDVSTSLMGFATTYKQNITLLVYGPDDSVVESWTLVGAWPKAITRKELTWEDSTGHQEISVTIAIDQAVLTVS